MAAVKESQEDAIEASAYWARRRFTVWSTLSRTHRTPLAACGTDTTATKFPVVQLLAHRRQLRQRKSGACRILGHRRLSAECHRLDLAR